MNIVAALKSSAEVPALVAAGADEFFCGLTPPGWHERFGEAWANRRAPLSAGVCDLADFDKILSSAEGRPVHVALNAPYYPPGGVEELSWFGRLLLDRGASSLIVADLSLLLTLADGGMASRLHLSSLATCTNAAAAGFFRDLGLSRIVLPRHLTTDEIAATVVEGVEFEAFLLNNGCVFEEGLCATTHGAGAFCLEDGDGNEELTAAVRERYAFWKWTLNHCGCQTSRGYPVGPCGLCALPALLQAGVRAFKVVGREASLSHKTHSVALAAAARDCLRQGAGAREIRRRVMELRGAEALCEGSHLCYYPDIWREAPEREAS